MRRLAFMVVACSLFTVGVIAPVTAIETQKRTKKAVEIFSREPVVDEKGQRIGKKIVALFSPNGSTNAPASLLWTKNRCYVPAPTEAFAGARAVFVGKVISVSDPTYPAEELSPRISDLVRPIKVRFAVEYVYRGKKVREIEVGTRTGGLEWGYDFKVGEKYLVYAQEVGDKGRGLIVMGCGRSRLIKEATEDLKLLKTLSNPKKNKSSL